jgi:N-dimethylarginine dimethylaminohydrolase
MCPPRYFRVAYQINPWMTEAVVADADRAQEQWDDLVATLQTAGATIEILAPAEEWPDLVFTANAGIVNGNQFVPARFRNPERRGETPHDVGWFEAHGFRITELPLGVCQEGAGDALPFGRAVVAAYRFRSDAASHAYLSHLTGAAVRSIELVDERFYHLDLTLCPLDSRRAIVAPMGWDRYGRAVMESLVPEPLVLEPEEALRFCANSVVVGSTVVMPACPPRVGRQLEAWGFDVAVCDVSEFQKAGGACRCLTLALDVTLGQVTPGQLPAP